MEKYVVIGILIAGAIGLFIWRRKRQALKESQKWRFGTDSRVEVLLDRAPDLVTPGGVKLYFEPGLDKTQFPVDAIDRGVEACLERAACDYTVDRSVFNFSACILTGESDMNGDPAFKVYIGMHSPYYNSEWDKRRGEGHNVDHYVLVAGQITRIGVPDGEVIAIPFHNLTQSGHCATIMDYECEHGVLMWLDPVKFEATKIHGGGQGHPLLSGHCVPQARSLVAKRAGKCEGDLILTR